MGRGRGLAPSGCPVGARVTQGCRTEIDQTIKAAAITVPAAQAIYRRGLLARLRAAQDKSPAPLRAAFGVAGAEENAAPEVPQGPPFVGHFAGIMLRRDALDLEDPAFADLGPASHIFLVTQQNLESMLGEWAEELGVQIRRGVTMTDFTDDGTGVTVRLGDTDVRAEWLVGCDGGRSTVRKRAGFDFPGLAAEITGHQALVEMTGAEELQPGWITTPTGMYTYGPTPGRILTVELDGPPADRDAPITAAELQAALRAVSGVPVRITAVHSATRFTDNTRQVTSYRRGRALLAGDAAHVHSPFGGQGLNLGIGDAVNLGWKLAAVVRGRADEDLLDTYTAERHPIGATVLNWSRAQIALMRLDQRSKQLRAFMTELLATRDGTTTVFKRISGVLHRYDLGGTHERVGAVVPDFELSDGTRLGEHFADGAAVLFDLADSAELRALAANWPPGVRVVTGKPVDARELSGLLVRPDGYVAWAGEGGSLDGLAAAHHRWFRAACRHGWNPVVTNGIPVSGSEGQGFGQTFHAKW